MYNYYAILSVHGFLSMCLMIILLYINYVCSLSILPPNIEYHRINKITIV